MCEEKVSWKKNSLQDFSALHIDGITFIFSYCWMNTLLPSTQLDTTIGNYIDIKTVCFIIVFSQRPSRQTIPAEGSNKVKASRTKKNKLNQSGRFTDIKTWLRCFTKNITRNKLSQLIIKTILVHITKIFQAVSFYMDSKFITSNNLF